MRTINQQCLERDNFTCQYCGSKDTLEVHHIDTLNPKYYGADNSNDTLDNLVTFCRTCHRHEHRLLRQVDNKKTITQQTINIYISHIKHSFPKTLKVQLIYMARVQFNLDKEVATAMVLNALEHRRYKLYSHKLPLFPPINCLRINSNHSKSLPDKDTHPENDSTKLKEKE